MHLFKKKKIKRESSFNIMPRWMGAKITLLFSVKINMLGNLIFDLVRFCWSNSGVSEHPNLPFSSLTQPLQPGVEHLYYKQGGSDVGRGMGLRGWVEADQEFLRLYDLPALLICLRPALPHVAYLWSPTSSGTSR